MSGDAAIRRMRGRLLDIADLSESSAPDVAEIVLQHLTDTASSGNDPYGQPWQLRKDGQKPLTGVGKHIVSVAIGSRVRVVTRGFSSLHHHGVARGRITRRVLPVGQIPPALSAKIRAILTRAFDRATGGQ